MSLQGFKQAHFGPVVSNGTSSYFEVPIDNIPRLMLSNNIMSFEGLSGQARPFQGSIGLIGWTIGSDDGGINRTFILEYAA